MPDIFMSVFRLTGYQLVIFFSSSTRVVLFDNPGISKCFKTMFRLSPHLCFIIGNILDFDFTSLQLVSTVGRLSVTHHSVDFFFISFGIIGPIVVPLYWSSILEGVSSVANFMTVNEESQ